MASDTGTLDLTRVAAERRRLEAEAVEAVREHDVEHPAVVAQRIVDEVLRQARGEGTDEALADDREPGESRAIARRIVEDVLADEDAIQRAARAAAEVTERHQAEAAAREIRESADERPAAVPFEQRRTDLVYLVLPGENGPLVLLPGPGVEPDTGPYVPVAHGDLDVQGSDGAALVDRALAPLIPRRSAWQQIADAAEPHRGPTQYVAWFALVGMWLAAMAALVPLMLQSFVQTVDATPPDFWDDEAVVDEGAPPPGEEIEDPEELLDG